MKKEARENSKHVDLKCAHREIKPRKSNHRAQIPPVYKLLYHPPVAFFILASNAGMEASYLKNTGFAGGPELAVTGKRWTSCDVTDAQVCIHEQKLCM